MANSAEATKVITGKVRLSYVRLFEPQVTENGDERLERYSCSILIPKEDKETLRKIKAAIDAAIQDGINSKWGGKLPPNLKKPLRDGDTERPDDPAYAGHYFLNASSLNRPGIAKPIGKGPDGKMRFQEITDSTEVYSGCYARVSLNFYAYNKNGNKGVGAGINNVVKVQDGEYLGGRARLEDEFADVDFDDVMDFGDDDFLN